jgi:IS30 family transposase
MMSQRSKGELVEATRPRYLKANKAGKEHILNEFVANTGYHRKYAIRILKHGAKPKGLKKKGRQKVYQGEVVQALSWIWEICGRICSKRLKPFLPEIVSVLERQNELHLTAATKALLLSMSCATIDRCLAPARYEHPHGLSTTKPGTLLKKAIPVRTYTPWEDEKPGFVEIDLVAHCGETTEGQYLNTLTATDLATGWTECLAIPNKTQPAVSQAIQELRQRLPFPLLGLDSDNGSEFINDTLLRYCQSEQITFTRSRPYHKNDQAHVEQKNWSVVRHTVGYDRLETPQELALLCSIYADLRVYVNFFQPVLKLIAKEQVDGKTIKKYDQAATPYRRVLALEQLPFKTKVRLTNLYISLNPVALRASIDTKVARLWKIIR